MEKNKKHMDADEFFKSFTADISNQNDLDEFDREALEGLKLVKDPALAQKRLEDNIEKLFVEKKGKRKGGLYLVSIAASIVLAFGLFFLFNNVSKEALVADKAAAPPATNEISNIDDQIAATNSDAAVVEEKTDPSLNGQAVVNANNSPMKEAMVPAEVLSAEMDPNFSVVQKDSAKFDNYAFKPANEKYLELEKEKIINEESKREESTVLNQKNKSSVTTTSTDEAVANKDGVKSRAILKKNAKKSAETTSVETQVPAAKTESIDQTVVANDPGASDDNNKFDDKESKSVADTKVVLNNANTVNGTSITNNSNSNTGPVAAYTSPSIVAGSSTTASFATVVADKKAEYVGGQTAMLNFIKKNIQIPAGTPKNFSVGVKLYLDAKGKVKKIVIKNNTSGNAECDKEIYRLINSMPHWNPEIKGGKAVESSFWIDVPFTK